MRARDLIYACWFTRWTLFPVRYIDTWGLKEQEEDPSTSIYDSHEHEQYNDNTCKGINPKNKCKTVEIVIVLII